MRVSLNTGSRTRYHSETKRGRDNRKMKYNRVSNYQVTTHSDAESFQQKKYYVERVSN